MSRRTTGGALDWPSRERKFTAHGEFIEHRPTDAPTVRAAAVELAQRGLMARDIAQALGIGETAARQLLAWEVA